MHAPSRGRAGSPARRRRGPAASNPPACPRAGGAVARARLPGLLGWRSLPHVWNDGLTAALAALRPFIARDLRLGCAHAAVVRTAHLIALSGAQIPLAALAGRLGEGTVLGGGLVWLGAAVALLDPPGGSASRLSGPRPRTGDGCGTAVRPFPA